ncbi:hypothetical protein Fcan01_28421 [Folsomia candida]|uniref:Uncharacterized protein n=1 Tax=Folsomia candida TaxID=158441 RepID=A0A226CUZ6_FOLCA|nr:hypothetical protein Fcan01_28421 [Folsomia candida]
MTNTNPEGCLVPNLVWEVGQEFCYLFQKIAGLPFQKTLNKKEMSVIPLTPARRAICISSVIWMFFHTVACGLSLVFKLPAISNPSSEMDTMEQLQIFVNIYFTIFPLCFIGMSITIAFYPQVAPNIDGTFFQDTPGLCGGLWQKIRLKIMNHMALIISLKDPIEEKYFSIFEKIFTPRGETQRAPLWAAVPKKRSPLWLLNFLKLITWGSVFPIYLTGPGLVFLNMDPLNIWEHTSSNWTWILIPRLIVRILMVQFLATELVKSALAVLLVGLPVVQCLSKGTQLLRNVLEFKTRSNSNSVEIGIYSQFQVWTGYINVEYCYRTVPPLLFCGVCMIICSLHGTIRMYSTLPAVLYPLLPVTARFTLTFQFTLLPQAAEVYEKSVDFVGLVRRGCTGKYERKVAKSLRPVGIRCGPFGMISSRWTVQVANAVTDNTITLLMAD